ncbi:MAG TPA: glucarate dehydratase family protein [Solirubrobacteraceae bacterium]|jgi:glucarate dehydratase
MPVIERVRITPVAFADPPLLNAVGVHQPYALRAVLELETDASLTGLGETYADEAHLRRLQDAARALAGYDVFDVNGMYGAVRDALAGERGSDGHGLTGMITTSSTVDRVFSPFEVAALDVQGQSIGRPVSDLLGGAVRGQVPFSAYLFYKWAGHPGAEPDEWGEALSPSAIVAQAEWMTDEYGFGALKLKGGVMGPDEEIAAVRALRERFPELPIRLDPNAAWTVTTSLRVASELAGVLEYLEDPTRGQEGMAQVAARAPMPLATNMCVVAFEEIASAAKLDAVSIVLSDHHYWGGLGRSRLLAGICETLGWGLSMHSNSHLGISLGAMVHLAAATPNLTYACDTHWPWKTEDVVAGEPFRFRDGALAVPTDPGLGVRLDRDRLGELHEQYLRCPIRDRDDTGYRQSLEPGYAPRTW